MSTGNQPPLDHLPRFQEETIKMRVEGAREAIKRARYAFMVSTIASLAIIITAWNAYISWDRRFPLYDDFPKNDVTKTVVEQFIRQHVDSTAITVSLLGIRVGVSDLNVLGSFSLFVLSVWIFFTMRRQNHLVAVLLRDTQTDLLDIRRFVLSGISSFLTFTTLSTSDAPINTLKGIEVQKTYRFTRLASVLLFYLPVVALVFVISMDCSSIFWLKSITSSSHKTLYEVFTKNDQHGAFWMGKFAVMSSCALLMTILTAFLSHKARKFEDATQAVLRQYNAAIKAGGDGQAAAATQRN